MFSSSGPPSISRKPFSIEADPEAGVGQAKRKLRNMNSTSSFSSVEGVMLAGFSFLAGNKSVSAGGVTGRFMASSCASSSRNLLPSGIARSSIGSNGGVSCPGRCCLVGRRPSDSWSMIGLPSCDTFGRLPDLTGVGRGFMTEWAGIRYGK